jgi:hypothetical protein
MTGKTRSKLDHYGKCPVCNCNWDGGSILDTFLEQKKKGHWTKETEDDIKRYVHSSYAAPYRWSNLIAIEKQGDDYISSHMCPECECEFPLFTEE